MLDFGLSTKTRFETTISAFLRRELQIKMLEVCDADIDEKEKNEELHTLALEMGFAQTKAKDIGSTKAGFEEFKKDYIRRHPADAEMIFLSIAGVDFGDATIRPSNAENLRISPKKKVPRTEAEFEDIALQEAQDSIRRNLFDEPRSPEIRRSFDDYSFYEDPGTSANLYGSQEAYQATNRPGTSQEAYEATNRPGTSQRQDSEAQNYSSYSDYLGGDYYGGDYYGGYQDYQ